MRRRRISDTPIDSQIQQEIVEEFELRAIAQQTFYRTVFTIVILVPTLAFVTVPYCRRNPVLSLQAVVALVGAAYGLWRLQATVSKASLGMAAVVGLQSYLRHGPWHGQDFIWLLPATGSITSLILLRWFKDMDREILSLRSAQYELRGA